MKVEKKELLTPVKAVNGFSDGSLREFFEKYGYPCEWPRDEVRRIPMWLINRVIQSGGEIELLRD